MPTMQYLLGDFECLGVAAGPGQSICLAYVRLRAPSAAPAKRTGKDKIGRGDWYKVPGYQETQDTLTFGPLSSMKHKGS